MVDRRRQNTQAGRAQILGRGTPQGLPHVYRGRGAHSIRDIYDSDHGHAPPGGRFRWLISTILAAAVGSIAIVVVIYGSADGKDRNESLLPALRQIGSGHMPEAVVPRMRRNAGLNWYTPKSDRMEMTSGASSTRFIIHETLKQRRNGREYIHAKPYMRLLARLAPPPEAVGSEIPPFNPFKLYANANPITNSEDGQAEGGTNSDVTIRVVELLGGVLPVEDQQQLETSEVAEIVAKTEEAIRTPLGDNLLAPLADNRADAEAQVAGARAENTTNLVKTIGDVADTTSDLDDGELVVVRAGKGDTLSKVLAKSGADRWQAKAMVEAARGIFSDRDLEQGQEVHVTLVASLTDPARKEPARFSVYADGHIHKVSVTRGPSGVFEASRSPFGAEAAVRALLADENTVRSSNLYSSLYYAALVQSIPAETIVNVLKIHAYDTDYRRRLRVGDQLELFFDVKDDKGPDAQLGELLYTAITAGGETSRFYRFRTADGVVDFYDDKGNNSKRFLMRRPVRGTDVRLTSGFGFRFHPLLNDRKMHTGVDWAAPTGTPILAAGNGVIEQAGRKGQYGNYVRIRHANGYQTAYAHMSRIAPGVQDGIKVRQGQTIGYVGSTGLSSGPHLHFEVLVNSQFVNPMSIQVPRERQLDGKQLAEFQKERARIDELMRRAPVMTASK
ncbi:MAG: M23 family metallopeptidase [Hyphomicrobiaceae bacterium]|nr:M23 family metallopeptidase [Hyphomicrobiaceae bacterium]